MAEAESPLMGYPADVGLLLPPCGISLVNVAMEGSWAGFELLADEGDESFSQMRVDCADIVKYCRSNNVCQRPRPISMCGICTLQERSSPQGTPDIRIPQMWSERGSNGL